MKKQKTLFKSVCILVAGWMASVAVAGPYSGGTGEPNTPYIIASEADLLELSSEPTDFSRHFLLTKDLDLIDKDLMPIGWAGGNEFTGVFDGNDHKIFNLTLNLPDEDYVGLFGHIGKNGIIRNLGLEGINIIGNGSVGGLAGESFQGIVNNCYSKGVIHGDSHVGGLVGNNSESTLSNCYSTAVVNGQSYNAGGLVGLNKRSVVNNSYYSTGTVHGSRSVGGLVGFNLDSTVIHCYSTAEVIGGSTSIGGLVGRSGSNTVNGGAVINCYATGTVEGNEYVGGLVGDTDKCTVSNCYSLCEVIGKKYVGGLVGDNVLSGVDNCYSAGKVTSTGTIFVGGLIGDSFYSHASNCFWNIEDSTQSDSAGGTEVIGLMKVDMQDINIYHNAGWDFIDESENGLHQIWQMSADTGYPVLSIFNGYRPVELPGMGTEQEPYQISTTEQMGSLIHADSSGNFQLISDIDASGINWTIPIFPTFAGVLDGNDHTIHDIKISSGRNTGVFGLLKKDGIIKNLRVYDVNCAGGDIVGGLAGENNGEIINCSANGEVTGYDFVGLLVGSNRGILSNCYTSGAVEGEKSVGGLIGLNQGTVSSCYSKAAVIGVIGDVGGLIGLNTAGTVSNCYSMAAVIGGGQVGGLIGSIRSGVVNNCYSVGEVTGDFSLGGLVGSGPEEAVTYSFWDIDTSGLTESAGGIDSNTADMQDIDTFRSAGWDFVGETENGTEDIWKMWDGYDYPRLAWEPGPNTPLVFVDINDSGAGMKDYDDEPISHGGFNGQMSKYETTNAQYCEFLNAALADGLIEVKTNENVGLVYDGGKLHSVYRDIVRAVRNSYLGPYTSIYPDPYLVCADVSGDPIQNFFHFGQIAYDNGVFSVITRDGQSMVNHPVVEVSWFGAKAFCDYYGYRLPTEWEWHAVADYDGSYIYGCGTTIDPTKANYYGNNVGYANPLELESYPYTAPVGYYPAYGYGMCDMAGNVWEWTSSLWNSGSSLREVRGGSWRLNAGYNKVSAKKYGGPDGAGRVTDFSDYNTGFRVCQ